MRALPSVDESSERSQHVRGVSTSPSRAASSDRASFDLEQQQSSLEAAAAASAVAAASPSPTMDDSVGVGKRQPRVNPKFAESKNLSFLASSGDKLSSSTDSSTSLGESGGSIAAAGAALGLPPATSPVLAAGAGSATATPDSGKPKKLPKGYVLEPVVPKPPKPLTPELPAKRERRKRDQADFVSVAAKRRKTGAAGGAAPVAPSAGGSINDDPEELARRKRLLEEELMKIDQNLQGLTQLEQQLKGAAKPAPTTKRPKKKSDTAAPLDLPTTATTVAATITTPKQHRTPTTTPSLPTTPKKTPTSATPTDAMQLESCTLLPSALPLTPALDATATTHSPLSAGAASATTPKSTGRQKKPKTFQDFETPTLSTSASSIPTLLAVQQTPPGPTDTATELHTPSSGDKSAVKRKRTPRALDTDDEGSDHKRARRSGVSLGKFFGKAKRVLRTLMKHEFAWPFNTPVDPLQLGLPDYHLIIKTPMDFGTINSNLESNLYPRVSDFATDVRLVFTNCTTYNKPESDIVLMCNALSKLFESRIAPVLVEEAEFIATAAAASAVIEPVSSAVAPAASVSTPTSAPAVKKPRTPKHHTSSTGTPTSAGAATTPTSGGSGSGHSKHRRETAARQVEEIAPEHMKDELQTLRDSVKSMQQMIQHLTQQQQQKQQQAPSVVAPTPSPKPIAASPAARPAPTQRTPVMSTEEKHQLSQLIQSDKLGNEHLATIVGIIREKLPAITDNEADEIVIDLDALDNDTLRRLERYVRTALKQPARKRKPAPPRKRPSTGTGAAGGASARNGTSTPRRTGAAARAQRESSGTPGAGAAGGASSAIAPATAAAQAAVAAAQAASKKDAESEDVEIDDDPLLHPPASTAGTGGKGSLSAVKRTDSTDSSDSTSDSESSSSSSDSSDTDTDSSSAAESNARKSHHHHQQQRPPIVNPKDGSVVSAAASASKSESALEEQVLFVVETTPSSTTEGGTSERDSQTEAMDSDPVLPVLQTTTEVKQVVIENAASWNLLDEDDDVTTTTAGDSGDTGEPGATAARSASSASATGSASSISSEPLWSKFKKQEQLSKEKERERLEREEKFRKQQEEFDRQLREEQEARIREVEEAEAKRREEQEERDREAQQQIEAQRQAARLARQQKVSSSTNSLQLQSSIMATFESTVLAATASPVLAVPALALPEQSEQQQHQQQQPEQTTTSSSDT